jgi:DNA-binding response OmpR family regulator
MRLEKKSQTTSPKKGVVSTLPPIPVLKKGIQPIGAKPSPSASPTRTQRRVLIIEDEPSIRNVLYVLLAGLGFEGDVSHSSAQALAMISRESFDAVLLDLRSSEIAAEKIVAQIREIRPSLVGRVLVITGEVADRETLELIERHTLPHVPCHRLFQDLRNRLRTVLGISN